MREFCRLRRLKRRDMPDAGCELSMSPALVATAECQKKSCDVHVKEGNLQRPPLSRDIWP